MICEQPPRWDVVADVVVLGSGVGGLTAATLARDGGADVVVLEKGELVGGTSGMSGGVVWIPLNRHMAAAGVADSRDEAIGYVHRVTAGQEPDPGLVDVYVDTAAQALDYLEQHTPLRMSLCEVFSDYYADRSGGKLFGRSLESQPVPAGAELGEWAGRVRSSPLLPRVTNGEGILAMLGREPIDEDLLRQRAEQDIRTQGSALVCSLVKGVLDRGVPILTATPARELVVLDGAVVGVRAERAGQPYWVAARKGVVLATGGFEWNEQMVHGFIGAPLTPFSASTNTGDGHVMAMETGAALANMWSYWGQPALQDPTVTDDQGRPLAQFCMTRTLPGTIVVNRYGRRFTNEGINYQDFTRVMQTFDPVTVDYPNQAPVWLILDHAAKELGPVLSVQPGEPMPDWVAQAGEVKELAEQIGVDPETLTETVNRFNVNARRGEDPDFRRGTLWFEGFPNGQPDPQRCLRPLDRPPFYALPVYNGTVGTHGGPRVDADGRVLSNRGGVVDGLYAAGNVAACVWGPTYVSGGCTLGPAMTFGYLAGRHVAAQPARTTVGHPGR